jgi:hypothetical protein
MLRYEVLTAVVIKATIFCDITEESAILCAVIVPDIGK